LQAGMQVECLRHVVRSKRRTEHLRNHAGAEVHQPDDVRDRKTAAGPLGTRLAELFLQRLRVRHRESRSVDEENAMPQPPPVIEHLASKLARDTPQEKAEDLQRHPHACLAVGPGRECHTSQSGEMRQRRIAVKNLQHEQSQGHHRPEHPFRPAMSRVPTRLLDHRVGKLLGPTPLELSHQIDDTGNHPWPPA